MSTRTESNQETQVRDGNWFLGLYQPSQETAEFWAAIGRDELLLKRCPRCDRFYHPRATACTNCTSASLEWKQSAGHGHLYSYTAVQCPTPGQFAADAPYAVGIAELDEGVFLFGRIACGSGSPSIGAATRTVFEEVGGTKLPVFVTGD